MNFVSAWSQQVTYPAATIKVQNQQLAPEENSSFRGKFGVYSSLNKTIANQTECQKRTLLFLENRYLKLMILPEVGG